MVTSMMGFEISWPILAISCPNADNFSIDQNILSVTQLLFGGSLQFIMACIKARIFLLNLRFLCPNLFRLNGYETLQL